MFKNPDTVLNLYEDIPVADGLNIAFRTPGGQAAYFNARRVRQVTGMTQINYLGGKVRIQGDPTGVLRCNYLSFNNVAYEGKPFYAKVSGHDWVNHNTVDIFFEIDYWQTFMFDALYRSSKIVREHLSASQWADAVANPYRNDIPELMTPEELPTIPEFEVSYKRPDGVAIRSDGKAAGAGPNSAAHPKGVTPAITSGVGATGLVTTYSGGGYTSGGKWDFRLVFQIAGFDGSDDLKALFDFATPNHYDTGYRNGFSRGFFLGVLGNDGAQGAGVDGEGGLAQDITTKMTEVLDYMTANNITHQILGIWVVPPEVAVDDVHVAGDFNGVNGGWVGDTTINVNVPSYEDLGYGAVRNPKLRRAPYRYVRAVSPSGEEKSLYIERFGNGVKIRAYGNFDDVPALTVAPQQYDGSSLAFKDRLVFKAYPQVGYNIDGFLAHIAAQNTGALLGETATGKKYREQYGSILDESTVGGNVKDTLMGAVGGDPLAGARTNRQDAMAREAVQQLNNAEQAQSFDADKWTSIRRGDKAGGVYEHQRGALIGAGDYVAGNAEGSLGMRLGQAFFEFVVVTLRAEIIKQYDDYLTAYGYASRRLGVPRVAAWTKGGGDPLFVDFDGLTTTYVQTDNLKVYGVYEPAAAQIASLFNAGCRFIKGE